MCIVTGWKWESDEITFISRENGSFEVARVFRAMPNNESASLAGRMRGF